jgi:hypothetical protein
VVQFVRTNDQLADILTNPLPRIKFIEMKERIGIAKVNAMFVSASQLTFLAEKLRSKKQK